ncbi:MAG: hypothetical protein IPJ74_13705 [Saprospiraceae bacterium]|nr:hypothetical protein [Saprospiraceae bacterium]
MNQILKIKYILILGLFIILLSCFRTNKVDTEKILVTYDGIPNVSIGDSVLHIIEGNTNYSTETRKVQSYGTEFMQLILKKGNEEIAYINYNENSLDWALVSTIVCNHPKCTTKDGLSIGMNIKDLRKLYPDKDDTLRGGKDESIGYFIPETLTKKKIIILS